MLLLNSVEKVAISDKCGFTVAINDVSLINIVEIIKGI